MALASQTAPALDAALSSLHKNVLNFTDSLLPPHEAYIEQMVWLSVSNCFAAAPMEANRVKIDFVG